MNNKHGIQNGASNWTAASPVSKEKFTVRWKTYLRCLLVSVFVSFATQKSFSQCSCSLPAAFTIKQNFISEPNGQKSYFIDTDEGIQLGNKIPLLLVHGIDREQTPGQYKDQQGNDSGINGWCQFLNFFYQTPELYNKYKIYRFAYQSNQETVDSLGKFLRVLLNRISNEDPTGFGNKDIVIVAHSMGGLVSRVLLAESYRNQSAKWGDHVVKLITLATPHYGTPVAHEVYWSGPLYNALTFGFRQLFYDASQIGWHQGASSPGPAWHQPNRSDLLWDNFYEPLFTYGDLVSVEERYPFLWGFNTTSTYDGKLILYAGTFTAETGHGFYWAPQDALFYGLGLPSDGVVPLGSALFDNRPLILNSARHTTFTDYDHTQMWQGKCGDNTLFNSLKQDLVTIATSVSAPGSFSFGVAQSCAGNAPVNVITWGASDRATSFRVYRDSLPLSSSLAVNVREFRDNNVTPGQQYFYKVTATSANSLTTDSPTFPLRAPNCNVPDTTAPGVPIITGNPTAWSRNNLFYVGWNNPSDPSGIAKVWWKPGSAPTSATDGTSLPLPLFNPLPITLNQSAGTQTVYLWLEDGAANKDYRNTVPVTLRLDTTRPIIAITSHSTAVPYPSTQNTITVSGTFADTLSGVVSVTWLNNVGSSGTATTSGSANNGTWFTPSITLYSGVNNIVVTAIDAAGNVSSATITVNYLDTSNSGTVNVTINPQAAVTAGALWHFAGETVWRTPGVAVSGIAAGNRTVEFKGVDNWITPQAITQNVLANQTTFFTGQYVAGTVTQAPDVPSNPYPLSGDVNIPRSGLTLTWSGSHPTGYPDFAVKFGTDNPPPFRAGFGTVPGRTYNPTAIEPLLPGTTYYWGVRGKVGDQITDGPVWRFTTEYSYADLIPYEIVVDGNIEPGANVTVRVKVKNQGTFTSAASCWLNLYLSHTPLGREQRISQIDTLLVPVLAPGAETELQQNVTLANLPAGQSFIDAWVDSANYGVNENDYQNNAQSLAINYIDGKNPVVTFARLSFSFVKTGQSNSIAYLATDDVGIKTMDFYYSTNSGLDWTPIEEGYVPPTPPTYGAIYPWRIPTNLPVGTNLLVRVVARDTSGNSGETNAGPYLIRSGTAPTVTVLSPNGGELWNMGSQQQISWNLSAPNGVGQFGVYFYRNNNIDVLPVPLPSGNGTYIWTLPTPFSTTNGLIRIQVTDLNGNTAEDYSDAYFSVRDTSAPPPAPWIDPIPVTSTAGGDPGGTSKIATDATGTAHLVYGLSHNGNSKTVTFRYKKRLNGVWTQAIPVSLDVQSNDNQMGVNYGVGINYGFSDWSLAVDSLGNPHLVWTTTYGFSEMNKADVFYAYFNGSSWSQPQNLSQTILGGYPTTTLAWQTKSTCPATEAYEAAVANNKLYVFANGGATYEYNPTGNQWTPKTSAPGGVSSYGAAEVNGLIYDLNISRNILQIYNPGNDSWSTSAAIPATRSGMSIIAVGGKVYAIGGSNSGTVEAYDPQGNSWSTKADMPTARNYAAAAVVNGKIYVIGGSDGSGYGMSTVEVYDPSNNTWAVIPEPVAAQWPVRARAVAVTLNNRIYLMGGRVGNTYLATVDEFDPATSSWQPMKPMSMARVGAVAGVIQSQIVIVGGYDGSSGSTEMATITGTVNGAISDSTAIAIDSNNTVSVAWRDGSYLQPDANEVSDFSFVGQADIYLAAKLSGQSWSLPSRLTTSSANFPTIAVGGANYLHLAYVTGRAVGYKRWDGTTWSGEGIAVTNANVQFSHPRLAANTNNQLHLVWKSYDQSSATEQIDYTYFDGSAWSAKESVAGPGGVNYPTVGVDSFNRPHVTWEEWAPPLKIYYSGRTAGLWSPRIQLNRDAQGVADYSSGAALFTSSNELHVVWNSSVSGNTEVIYNHANVGSTNDIFGPSVSVTVPVVGANLSIGSSFSIQWNATDNTGVTTVSIHYNTNNGSSWTLVATNQANSGTYAWLVPNLGANAGQVRVSARDAAGNSGVGFSGTFTTTDLTPPTITITAPTNGATLIGDATNNVGWTATDNAAIARIDLEYSLNNGASWSDMATNLTNGGSYPWLIPSSATTVLLIRATARDTAGLSASATTQPMTIVRANTPPLAPNSPFPLHGSPFVPTVSPQFSWSSSDLDGDPLTYQIRFGTNATPPIVSSASQSSFVPSLLRPQKTYYWQVIASDGKATTAGPVWSFTTEAGALPATVLADYNRTTNGGFQFRLSGLFGESYSLQASTNLTTWQTLTNIVNTNGNTLFLDTAATNFPRRFYRAVSP